ncbi:MAG: RsmD family RNA methyltransferase, partial [Chloroflexi bacterium]|nr:RsmD family RNA methyltransferase [Chloroflexota bacterium]
MRITGGEARGLRLAVPRSLHVRPTSDRVRGALFQLVGQTVANANVLDLYAGTGALGIEALSRGAASVD